MDPTRPVIGNDGWESVATDIIGIHDYDDQPGRIGRRYGIDDILSRLLKRERPGGRLLLVGDEAAHTGQPIMLTEFGGIAFAEDEEGTWGYSRSHTRDEFEARFVSLMNTINSLPQLAGFCYTQFTDTYQEANGLLYVDRTPKIPIEVIAEAVSGERRDEDAHRLDVEWRERLMNSQRDQYLVPRQDYQVKDSRG
jgi:hypothetical protein